MAFCPDAIRLAAYARATVVFPQPPAGDHTAVMRARLPSPLRLTETAEYFSIAELSMAEIR